MISFLPRGIGLGLLMGFQATALLGASPLRLELRERYEAAGGSLRVGDIVEAHSDTPEGLLSVPLGSPPALGKERTWSRDAISRILLSRWDNLSFDWEGGAACRVTSPARTCELDELRKCLLASLRKLTANAGAVEIVELAGVEPFLVPVGAIETRIEFAPTTTTNPWSTATLRYVAKGDTVVLKSVRFHWRWQRNVWQSTRAIASGSGIEDGDFKAVPSDVLRLGADVYQGEALPTESRLTQAVAGGTVLSNRHFKPTILVKKGDSVTVRYSEATFRMTLKAMAMEDGARGSVISIQNPSSRKQFRARVLDASTLEYVNPSTP